MAINLTERRAAFIYNAARLAAISSGAPIIPDPWSQREKPFRDQFLQVIERQCGEQRSRSPEELHGSWMQAYYKMGWVYGEKYDREKKIHPDLVPYSELGQLEQDKDSVFVALCEIARQWIQKEVRDG
ncbi:MAG TPA: ryR domain protein [Marinobacter sp.]|uniref:Ryanodine receptor Ryr domain-containing protein n=1 Tax=marine sediment metagenome TaxID=412755 RepID=A0A0F9R164_9ZZZZ|nr:ryR domain protein [Marinobacter sp.]